jgi:hypothetical protein
MNLPHHVGERYLCFIVVKPDRGYGGPYGMTPKPAIWRCEQCGHEIRGEMASWARALAAKHHECGHAPCERCGQMLLKRKDGTPRQHRHDQCAGKNGGYRIEREFAKNITVRELH